MDSSCHRLPKKTRVNIGNFGEKKGQKEKKQATIQIFQDPWIEVNWLGFLGETKAVQNRWFTTMEIENHRGTTSYKVVVLNNSMMSDK